MHVIGNWKLNGNATLVDTMAPALNQVAANCPAVSVVACPPDIWIGYLQGAMGYDSPVATGGQTCHSQTSGAYTGESSATHLAEVGCRYVILGHSERRQLFGETSEQVAVKASIASDSGLRPVICIGESLEEREAGTHVAVCQAQLVASMRGLIGGWLTNAIVAYEPIWAIGTGKVAGINDVAEMSAAIRQCLIDTFGDDGKAVSILYGGSVNQDNAAEIFGSGGVQGALVGGASLKPDSFAAIVEAAQLVANN